MTHAIGDTIIQVARRRTHRYTLASIEPHATRQGAQSVVLHWPGTCAKCGAPFVATSSRNVNRRPKLALTQSRCSSNRLGWQGSGSLPCGIRRFGASRLSGWSSTA
jgi:hypothetical protein